MALVFRVLALLALAAPAAGDVTDRLTRAVPLPPGAPLSLHVTVGDVHVSTWDRPELSVDIVRRAPGSGQLSRMPPLIDASANGVRIRVVQNDQGRDAALRSDVTLRVPAAARLEQIELFEGRLEITGLTGACRAMVERGDIVGRDLAGAVRLETGMGDIHLERATLTPDGVIHLRTFNGNVTLALASRPANARILALSMGGTISSDIPLNRREEWGPRWGEATLGTGEPVISIDVVNGKIRIVGN